jgi:hypothetical protein
MKATSRAMAMYSAVWIPASWETAEKYNGTSIFLLVRQTHTEIPAG